MIDIYHPFDIHPTTEVMFDGKTLSQSSLKKYKENLDKKAKEKYRILSQSRISYIEIDTSENIENRLNYFFKERYHD